MNEATITLTAATQTSGLIESNEEFRKMVIAALGTYFRRNPGAALEDLACLLASSGVANLHFKK